MLGDRLVLPLLDGGGDHIPGGEYIPVGDPKPLLLWLPGLKSGADVVDIELRGGRPVEEVGGGDPIPAVVSDVPFG